MPRDRLQNARADAFGDTGCPARSTRATSGAVRIAIAVLCARRRSLRVDHLLLCRIGARARVAQLAFETGDAGAELRRVDRETSRERERAAVASHQADGRVS